LNGEIGQERGSRFRRPHEENLEGKRVKGGGASRKEDVEARTGKKKNFEVPEMQKGKGGVTKEEKSS